MNEEEEEGNLMILEGVKMNKEEHEFEDCLLQWRTEGKHYQSKAKFRAFCEELVACEVDWLKEVQDEGGDGEGQQQHGQGGDAGGARLHRCVQLTWWEGTWPVVRWMKGGQMVRWAGRFLTPS